MCLELADEKEQKKLMVAKIDQTGTIPWDPLDSDSDSDELNQAGLMQEH